MTETDQTNEIDELRETVQSLRERVSELERRLDSGEGENSERDAYDHYDKAAIEFLDDEVANAHPRRVIRAYESAGIVDDKTKKRRAKRLKRLEGGGQA